MIARYSIFILSIIFLLVLTGLVVKPVKVYDVKISDYKDPFSKVKEVYAKILWEDITEEKDFVNRFEIVKRVLSYNPDFRPAYNEMCLFSQNYITASIDVKDYIKLTKQGAETFEDNDLIDCYIKVLTGMERYFDALTFLHQEYVQVQDKAKQDHYSEKIRKVSSEENVLNLTKAVEVYYQKTKTYPGDILVLVSEGVIDKIPDDPYGGQYFISRQGQIKSTSEITKDEN